MHSDAASQGGGWWQGCGAAYDNVGRKLQPPSVQVVEKCLSQLDITTAALKTDAATKELSV